LKLSEHDLWRLTFEEFYALRDRYIDEQDFYEYCAALSPWAIYNTNRSKEVQPYQPKQFMFLTQAREAIMQPQSVKPSHNHAPMRPARILAPVPAEGARWAKPGERPPSRYAPGESDQVIEQYDAWVRQWRTGGVKRA
jgi:hypothetical protein